MPSRKKASAFPERMIEFPQLTFWQRLRYLRTGDVRMVCMIRRYCRKCKEWSEEFPSKTKHLCVRPSSRKR